ncbi:hypothetical protein CWB41_16060 [Methylovirgula ligni]|uniref:Uncharacterized protein n=1 Tax=Methylovirgula ligni TaxID=569860 RepID=A0A3D9YYM9_9HYPH|nr:hypothetical protein [Methylovirgula ligni]QAY97444.1 hypothetical protein CWB41_16060 [Methylovirgula ligni]REF87863.1 hypothetical protein DES32_1495 [Methylovirgula ligni]
MSKLRALLADPNPYVVLAVAILLPGMGHVLAGQPKRGFTMQMFMILLAMITWHLTTPAQSLVGRLSGGLFVYALSIPEAYRLAKLRNLQSLTARS